jgi:MarR family transcriptional regulator, organic hydroperoxide resistance regulator
VPSAEFHAAEAGQPARAAAEPPLAGAAACAPLGPDGKPIVWGDWPGRLIRFPDDAPLHALMLTATRLLGAYGQHTVQATGLKVSLAGLGVLRVLMASDGLKSTELAEQAWSSPGTMTSVVNTLVKSGFVERRADAADRRVVRLYITDEGRALISYYVPQAAVRWRKAFDFVDEGDEAVIRGFFIQLIDHLSQLLREERGA